ncbi:hypothetical protein EHQ92_18145 [Leptospira biflexa]|uniref:type IV toxin-antitoxin system AbiEi family antitoxin domain-containing protein n=1 Tax=Leptospira biflexa TaxID=172 RepID=UPI001090B4AE|nr:hypothetical protein [Leptospira biflexa]TGM41719.1 hypothetical protein EHQ92_18145 [Leptospira biflexa]TGM43867.1 hypothetical protein EHQ88_18010 [Leptospira biflexa]
MYKTHQLVMEELSSYSSPKAKLSKMIKSNEIIHLKRGVFLDKNDTSYSLFSIASVLYGPSYISFESALSHYGMIPERVRGITSAIFNKKKNKEFHTPIGDFYYFYLPKSAYPFGIVRKTEDGQGYLIATPEKAILDVIYKNSKLKDINELRDFLVEDKRIEEEMLSRLNKIEVTKLCPIYNQRQCLLLPKMLRKYYA